MTATRQQFIEGIALYAESEILPALDGIALYGAAAALILAYRRADVLLGELMKHKVIIALGLVDEDGNIDVDAATDALKEVARKRGKLKLDIPLFGTFAFDENDIDKLRGYISRAGHSAD